MDNGDKKKLEKPELLTSQTQNYVDCKLYSTMLVDCDCPVALGLVNLLSPAQLSRCLIAQ